jgi:hypothetical protein
MKRNLLARLAVRKFWLPVLVGGLALQLNLSGCDPTVRTTVLTGIQTSIVGLMTAVVNAFFLSLSGSSSSTSQPVVQTVFEQLKNWLA